MPVQYEMALPDLSYPLDAELYYCFEMPILKKIKISRTYFFPVGTCRGLMSAFLKWANNSSHGAAS